MDFIYTNLDWFRAFHVISVIAWMAGMLYLPRLYVYHAEAKGGSATAEIFKIMERRLLRAIINPAMGATWIFGLILMIATEAWTAPWFHVKLTCLFLLMAVHGLLAKWRKAFAEDKNKHSAKFYRWVNEGPTVLMIIIVIMVLVKPFS